MHRRSLLAPPAAGNLAELPLPAAAAAELDLPAFWPSASVSLLFWRPLAQLPVPPLPAAAE